ncbi:hypothetical protein [Streptomyces sp. NPDC048606]|uniref:hypothetical protein n=1 Tax=Streptomyces sp. NPDC048606 TaxID=3154726 RepID=UPI003443A17F
MSASTVGAAKARKKRKSKGDGEGPEQGVAVVAPPVEAVVKPVEPAVVSGWEARQAVRQAQWEAFNGPNPVAEAARTRQREEAEARRRAEAAEVEARKQAEAEAVEVEEELAAGDDVETEGEAASGWRRWWSLKPDQTDQTTPAADGAEGGAAPAVPAAPVETPPVLLPGGVRRIAASRWGWLAYHGSAAAVGHGALWGLTGNRLGGAMLLDSAIVSVVPVTTAAVACCAGWAGWQLGRWLRPYLPFGRWAAPVGLFAGLGWGQGATGLVADVFAWAAPWPVLAAPAVIAALAGAGCWAFLDRQAHARDWAPPLRWAAHIPLATVALSAALHAPGALL